MHWDCFPSYLYTSLINERQIGGVGCTSIPSSLSPAAPVFLQVPPVFDRVA